VAAVADYRPATSAEHKIKKSGAELSITLTPNPDILADVANLPKPPFCVGFRGRKPQSGRVCGRQAQGQEAALIVGNLVQDGLGGDDNLVVLYDDAGRHPCHEHQSLISHGPS
jgi:phosphopantothenoylcysteine decarboxylase/phosphopantothenate--cysteine ligase